MRYPGTQQDANRLHGKAFEKVFERMCQLSGMYPIRNGWSCVHKNGRLQLVGGQLDYTICTKEGRVAFVDCKTFERGYFTFSEINTGQLTRARALNLWNVPAGFVVLFNPLNQVFFFSGKMVAERGRGFRFLPEHGTSLGTFGTMEPKLIFSLHPPSGPEFELVPSNA